MALRLSETESTSIPSWDRPIVGATAEATRPSSWERTLREATKIGESSTQRISLPSPGWPSGFSGSPPE